MNLHRRKNKPDTPQKTTDFFESPSSFCKHLWLNFNFRGVEFLINVEGITLGQLQKGVFYNGKEPYIDIKKACVYLLECGLVGSKQITPENYSELNDKVNTIIATWQERYGALVGLHTHLMDQCKTRHHFFKPNDKPDPTADLFKALEILDIHLPVEKTRTDDVYSQAYWDKILNTADKDLRLNYKLAMRLGASLDEVRDMDVRLFDMFVHAKAQDYEQSLNDETIGRIHLAIKVVEALNGSKKLTDTKPIDLHIEDDEEYMSAVDKQNAKVIKAALEIYKDQIADLKARGLI